MSGITGTSALVLALRADGARTRCETDHRALEMQKRTGDSAARTQAAAAEAMEALTKRNAELEAQLLAKDQAHSITIIGHAAEKTALEARVVSLEETVGMRDRMIASLQAIIENVKAAIRYLHEFHSIGSVAWKVRTIVRCFVADYLTNVLEGKPRAIIGNIEDSVLNPVGIPLRI